MSSHAPASSTPAPRRPTRQPKISHHLKSSKSSTPSPKLIAPRPLAPSTSRPTLYPSEPSRLSRLPHGREEVAEDQVAGMEADEVEKRLREEKEELLGRLATHG